MTTTFRPVNPRARRIADIVASCSVEPESFGRVAIEAQALKTPIISACEEGGLGEILMNGEAGLITKNDDVNEMKNSIEKYLQNPEMALSHSELGFNNIGRFALETSAKEYLTKFSNYFEENV